MYTFPQVHGICRSVGPDLNAALMLKSLSLTPAWPILFSFPVVLPQRVGSRDEATKGFREVVFLLPEVQSQLPNTPVSLFTCVG